MKKIVVALASFLVTTLAFGTTFNLFAPANGVLKGNSSTYVTTAAASSDIYTLWSGTCNSGTYLRGDGTCAAPPGTGGGTVNSVALTAPAMFSVSGSPVTTTGTLALTFATGQTANSFLATPNGSTGAVTLRTIVAADLPSINLTSGVTGILPFGNGGTGATSFTNHGVMVAGASALSSLAVLGTDTLLQGTTGADPGPVSVPNCGSSTQALAYSTSTHLFSCQTISAGTGTVTSVDFTAPSVFAVAGNPVTSSGTIAVTFATGQTANRVLASPNGSTGAVALRALAGADIPAANLASSTNGGVTGLLPVANGGTGIGSGTSGGIPYFSGSTTVASSSALTANAIVLGGGTGGTPTNLGSLGTTTTLLHGNASGAPTFAAVSLIADVSGNLPVTNLNSGTSASGSTFWSGAGTWTVPSANYPTSALETSLSITPTDKSYVYGDPRRAPSFYPSEGWTDFGDVPTYVSSGSLTVPTDVTARYLPLNRMIIVGSAGTQVNVLITGRSYSAPNTTITFNVDTGGSTPTTQVALWVQTSAPSNSPASFVYNYNSALGLMVNNLSTGTLSASRYAAFTSNSSGVADSSMILVSVSPNYSGSYLGNGYTTGARGVLYTAPTATMEIGTSDQARIKIPSNSDPITFLSAIEAPNGTASTPGLTFAGDHTDGIFWTSGEIRTVTNGTAREIIGDTYIIDRVQHLAANGSNSAPSYSFENNPTSGLFLLGTNEINLATNGQPRLDIGSTGAVSIAGPSSGTTLTLSGTSSSTPALNIASGTLQVGGSAGSSGQVLTSGGSSAAPTWAAGASITTGTGTFTLSTDCSGSGTQGYHYRIVGNVATVWMDGSLTCSSTGTTLTFTGLNGAVTPTTNNRCVSSPVVEDNGVFTKIVGACATTTGTVSFIANGSTTGFTGSGTKGVAGLTFTITYPLD